MNWTQYLLGKLAEECTEVAKEALKNQQQGVGSEWHGRPAILTVRSEFYESMAMMQMLSVRPDVQQALGNNNYLLPPVHGNTTFDAIVMNKKMKVCYYAMFAIQSGNLKPTQAEFESIKSMALKWGAENNMDYIGNIEYTEA